VTRDLRFSGLIRRTTPFSRLSRHTRCGGSTCILTRILTNETSSYLFATVNVHASVIPPIDYDPYTHNLCAWDTFLPPVFKYYFPLPDNIILEGVAC
jgi:hypothetical protein